MVDCGETFDPYIDERISSSSISLIDTVTTACGNGMMILTLLDFVRLYLGIPLVIGGVAFETTAS